MSNFLEKFLQNIGRRTPVCFFIVFILSFLFFYFVIQPLDTFPDPDSFYHAKIGEMMRDGIIDDFPWLQFTGLKNYFTDHHLLYHLFLIPFISFFGGLLGTKIASVFFAALLMAIFYWLLKIFEIRGAILYILILLSTYPFIFRINLAKSGVLAIIILLCALYALFKYKPILLFALSFLYVWTHGSWPTVLGLTIFYCFSSFLVNRSEVGPHQRGPTSLVFSCFLGLVAGIVASPYFPNNLIFYWLQTIKIGFLNYQNEIGVGAEWYASKFNEFFTGSALVFVLFFMGFAGFIYFAIDQKPKYKIKKEEIIRLLTLALISGAFFVLTIKSRRNVEYFVPLTTIFSAFTLNLIIKNKNIIEEIKKFILNKKFISFILSIYFLSAVLYLSFLGINGARNSFEAGFNWDYFKNASKVIEEQSNEREIVFHSSWDNFPFLFYYNTKNYYIVGLDPTFFYLYDKDLYEKWENIRQGEIKENLYEIIKIDFSASWIFVDKKYKEFKRNIERAEGFVEVWEDEESVVYKVEP